MREIRDRLKVLATLIHEVDKCNQLDYIGEAIEAEIEKLAERIEALGKFVNSQQIDIEKLLRIVSPDSLKPQDPLPYDKICGTLKRGDMISYIDIDGRKKWALFHHQKDGLTYGYFQDFTGNFRDCVDWTERPVGFEFRPFED